MKKAKEKSGKWKLGRTKFRVNKELDKYQGVSLAPEKVARANEVLKNVKLPF